ncbi:hypothetical protein ACQKFS_02565 [Pseudomonas guineae]|uniref:hypothetical protein n=1 Tax=Pseudomonas guineae TaxID=425504 RepID=UPI003D081D6C
MQCPSCEHEAPQADFGDPLRCPDCGAFYEKALELKLRREYSGGQPAQAPTKPIKKRTAWPFFAIPLVIFFVVGILNIDAGPEGKPPHSVAKESSEVAATVHPPALPAESEPEPLSAAESALALTRLEFKGSKDGGLLYVDFTVINNSPQKIKDIEIECIHNGKSGSRIDSNKRTIYDIVDPRSRKTFKRFSMGIIHSQATQTRCSINGLKV